MCTDQFLLKNNFPINGILYHVQINKDKILMMSGNVWILWYTSIEFLYNIAFGKLHESPQSPKIHEYKKCVILNIVQFSHLSTESHLPYFLILI